MTAEMKADLIGLGFTLVVTTVSVLLNELIGAGGIGIASALSYWIGRDLPRHWPPYTGDEG